MGDTIELKTQEANQLDWQTGMTTSVGGGVSFVKWVGGSVLADGSEVIRVGYQSSAETFRTKSTSAACHLVRNQNVTDLSGIQVYYDKVFSTLMFRKMVEGGIRVVGVVTDPLGVYLDRVAVELVLIALSDIDLPEPQPKPPQPLPIVFGTTTAMDGSFDFKGLWSGRYILKVGDREEELNVALEPNKRQTRVELDLRDVRRKIKLHYSPVWEVQRALGLEAERFIHLRRNLRNIMDMSDLLTAIGMDQDEFNQKLGHLLIQLPETPLAQIPSITLEQIHEMDKINLTSIQQLWTAVTKDHRLSEITEHTKIQKSTISTWVDEIEAQRVSKRKGEERWPRNDDFIVKLLRLLGRLIHQIVGNPITTIVLVTIGVLIGIAIGLLSR
jgi:hypothetical protein